MNRLDSDAVQQGQAKTQEQKRKYRSTKKNLRSARKTQKQLQRRRLQLAEQMQDAERRLFDLFLDMQQLDHRLRSTPSVLHTCLADQAEERPTSILAGDSENAPQPTNHKASPDYSTVNPSVQVERQGKKVDSNEHEQPLSETWRNALATNTDLRPGGEEELEHGLSIGQSGGFRDTPDSAHPDLAVEGGSVLGQASQPSESSWSGDTAVSPSKLGNEQVAGAVPRDGSGSNFGGTHSHIPDSGAEVSENKAAHPDPSLQSQKESEDPIAFMKDPQIIAAMDNIIDAKDTLESARDKYETHVETYEEQLDEYEQLNPDNTSAVLEEAFASKYFERGHVITQRLSDTEDALKRIRADARAAGLPCVHSNEQESGFFSVEGEGPNEETGKLVAQTCKRKRIEDWMKESEKTSKLQPVEAEFAFGGADVEPWESVSACNHDPNKKRKIHHYNDDDESKKAHRDAGEKDAMPTHRVLGHGRKTIAEALSEPPHRGVPVMDGNSRADRWFGVQQPTWPLPKARVRESPYKASSMKKLTSS
jgi:hypothetical protein